MENSEMFIESEEEALRRLEYDLRREKANCQLCGRVLYEDELLEHGTYRVCPQCFEKLNFMKRRIE